MVAIASTRMMIIGRPEAAQPLLAALNGECVAATVITEQEQLMRLRRDLLVHRGSVVICVELNDRALSRFGTALRGFLADRQGFEAQVRVIGFHQATLAGGLLSLGCDAYTRTVGGVLKWRCEFDRHLGAGQSVRSRTMSRRRASQASAMVVQKSFGRRLTEEQSVAIPRAARPVRGFRSRSRLL